MQRRNTKYDFVVFYKFDDMAHKSYFMYSLSPSLSLSLSLSLWLSRVLLFYKKRLFRSSRLSRKGFHNCNTLFKGFYVVYNIDSEIEFNKIPTTYIKL